jgi:beta-xylosidase
MSSSKVRWTILALALPTAPGLGGCDAQSDTGGALPVVWVPANQASVKPEGPDGGVEMSIPFTNNPVLPGYHADPQVALFGNTFYIYPTTDGFVNWTSKSFSVFSSTNLVNWTDRGEILDLQRDVTWARARAWAPGIVFKGGTYYLYFAAALQIGVATSTSPTGPFKDALGHPLITTEAYGVQSIDPYPFIDDDGTAYLYFGSGGARVVRLNDDMISFNGTPQTITATGYNEGSVMFKRGGSYYFLWSEHDTRSVTYQVAYGRAPSPFGPFPRLGVILQEDPALGILATGHNSVLSIPGRDEHYMVYHRFAIPNGDGYHREVCIDPMYFNADGTIVPVQPTVRGLQAPVIP